MLALSGASSANHGGGRLGERVVVDRGVDLDALDAGGKAFGQRLVQRLVGPRVVKRPTRRRQRGHPRQGQQHRHRSARAEASLDPISSPMCRAVARLVGIGAVFHARRCRTSAPVLPDLTVTLVADERVDRPFAEFGRHGLPELDRPPPRREPMSTS